MTYKDVISVAPRFARAVNVERDVRLPAAVEGYVVTSTAEAVLARLHRALHPPTGHRAWTLTGPYGSGKSAFAIFAAKLLGPANSHGGETARQLLARRSEVLHREFFDRRKPYSLPTRGFCPVVVAGTAEAFLPKLITACARDIRTYCEQGRGRPPQALKQLEHLCARLAKGHSASATEFIDALFDATHSLMRSGNSQGILLIIDELGKFLEFAARDPENNDIHVLQQLAEATALFPTPGLMLITILHQSFERYVAGLRASVRDEWSKVQGRFEDVAYQEPPEEFLELLAHAVQHADAPAVQKLRKKARAFAERAHALGLAPRGMSKGQLAQALQHCAPLHPLTVLVLARLCRKFGQNQRSLFSYLVSREPHGFSHFLEHAAKTGDLPFYELSDLYDYTAQALGSGLSAGEASTRWAEIQSALERCVSATDEEIRVIKTVGMLSVVGAYGNLKPSPAVVEFACGMERAGVQKAIEALLKRSVLVHRKHSDSFALWQGSDVDIDQRIVDGRKEVLTSTGIARALTELWTPRPLVAKRHSVQTGTLRYFVPRFGDVSDLTKAVEPPADADGLLLYVLPDSQAEFEEAVELATGTELRARADILIAISKETDALKDSVHELQLLRWVEEHTPELRGDAIARREIHARISLAEQRLMNEVRSLFSPGGAAARKTAWFHRGMPQSVPSDRSLSNSISEICDAVYPHTPRLRNELLNRRALSSAAAAARRNLIDRMITRGNEPALGIEGAPPEMSMYASVLASTGVHRAEESGYAFGMPDGDPGLREVWSAIEQFFATCELERRSVAELFATLGKPPFGLKMGVIPVLFCAAALAHDTEIALYENGAFVPEFTVELFERLLRSSEKFHLRRYRIAGVRREVFNQFAALLGTIQPAEEQNLVAIIRPLFRFFNRLPAYTKQTKTVTPTALAVREALFAAREPDILLFEDLPRACGIAPFSSGASVDPEDVSVFFQRLKKSLSELQRAYDDLLSDVQQVLFRAFSITGSKGREVLRFHGRTVSEHALEPRLRAFIHHLIDEELEDVAWIEAIATMLVGKPPKTWNDSDRSRYEVILSELARSFRHIEAIASELSHRNYASEAPGDVLRIGVTDRHSKDLEAVVVIEPHDQTAVAEAVIRIEEQLEQLRAGTIPTLALAALGTVSRKFLSEIDGRKAPVERRPEEVAGD